MDQNKIQPQRVMHAASTGVKAVALAACAAALCVGLGAWAQSAWAQEPNAGVRDLKDSDMPAGRVISPKENDQRIARWLNVDNNMIIESAKLAETQASNAEVKEFAKTLAAEHEKCRAELADMIKAADTTRRTTVEDTTPDRRRTAVVVTDDGARRDGNMVFKPADFLMVKENTAKHLGEVAKKHWSKVTGNEFDRAFMSHIVMAHECLMANIKEVRSSASAEFRTALDTHAEKLKGHCDAAKGLCERVCKNNPEGTKDK
jgi:predicted outer membrane protein